MPAGAPLDPVLAAVMARLEALVGLAPSAVLRGRLSRAAPLAARLAAREPHLDDPDWAALLDAVTVPETRMFRAAAQLAALREQVLPGLAGAAPLTLVSAGCATGEEAWTLAILAAGVAQRWRVEGLDLSRPALRQAEQARYHRGPPDALREVPQADRDALLLGAEGFEPAARLRPGVSFRRANLLDAPLPAGGADVILCRNVLIYLTESARARVLEGLVAGLRPGGALLLGVTDRPPPGLGLEPWVAGGFGIWRRQGATGG
jgi:chemotaxis protein methyltransferase CheR